MAEAAQDSPDPTQRLPEIRELNKLQRDIYDLLLKEKPQKALAVAKAMGKTRTRDVNPDLYKMQGWNLLDCNEDKLWSIKAGSRASENKAKMEQPNRTGSKTTSPLTEQQRAICTLLEENRPMGAKDIAKRLEKTRKDVNPDLYRLKNMDLLTHSEEKLWSLKSQNHTRCKERDEECEELGRSTIPSDNNHTDDTTSPNQTETENPNNQLCNGTQCNNDTECEELGRSTIPSDNNHTDDTTSPNQTETENPNNQLCNGTQCNSDTALIGVSSLDHTYVGGQYPTQVPNGWSTVQSYTHITPPVIKNYTFYIQNSQNFTIGDNLVNGGDIQDPGYITGDSAALTDGSDAQYAVQGAEQLPALEWPNSSQSEDGSMNASDLSMAEEIREPPPRTSSPIDPNPSRQCLNLSTICDGIEQLKLEQQDDHLS
ncbi:Z-DNA-binding protein 1 isoform X1 [Lithobates pipiens]